MKKHRRGFTLFEMMVSISIFVLITLVGILNYRKFGNDIFVDNLAYDIALSVRKAQSYGINVKEAKGTADPFAYAYGLHFAIGGAAKAYTLFVDTTADGVYTNSTELVETFSLLKNSYIQKLCVTATRNGRDTDTCTSQTDSAGSIDISFHRPNPDARIIVQNSSSLTPASGSTIKSAHIYIQSNEGRQKQIVVYAIGQVSVQDPPASGGGGSSGDQEQAAEK